jgi:hypothetical protein
VGAIDGIDGIDRALRGPRSQIVEDRSITQHGGYGTEGTSASSLS